MSAKPTDSYELKLRRMFLGDLSEAELREIYVETVANYDLSLMMSAENRLTDDYHAGQLDLVQVKQFTENYIPKLIDRVFNTAKIGSALNGASGDEDGAKRLAILFGSKEVV